MASLLRSGLA